MRCNPTYWLLGLVPIAMLSWVAVQLERENIEADLAQRSQAAMQRLGVGWAVPNFNGRDAILTGRADEPRDRLRALARVQDVWGVRVAIDRSDLLELVNDYDWSATLDSGRLRLGGHVPSEIARRSIVDSARSEFPAARIDDAMGLARSNLDSDAWLAGTAFSLSNLAQLKNGRASMSRLDLSMEGEARTTAAYRKVRQALTAARPSKIGLALERITPPVATPFVWSAVANSAQGNVEIGGYAPSDGERDRIAARVKSLFSKARIADRSDVADGAPAGWSDAVKVSLEQLALLRSGQADFNGLSLNFNGEAADEQTANAVRRTLKLEVPRNFKIIENIRFPRPDAAAAGGYLMGVVNDGSVVKVVGKVPSEAARSALVEAVKARFPDRTVTDETQVAPGAPEGWQQCVVAGLAALPRLKTGKSMLTDLKLAVTGATDDYAASQSVPSDVKAAAGQTCDATTSIAFTGQMKTNLSWRVTRDLNGMVNLEGEAPDEPSKQQLADMAQDLYAGSSVADAMKVAGAAAEPWMSVTKLAILQLAKLKRGEVSLAAKEVSVKGAAESEAVANDVRNALKSGVPSGYTVKDAITVMSADEKAADSCQTLMRQTTARGTINFERAKADLTNDSTATLKALADVANKCPAYKIEIAGHTDSEGTDERNQKLSDRRAQAVLDFLSRTGVDPKRMTTVGYGATRPLADNATADGRAKNRRIEFTVKAN